MLQRSRGGMLHAVSPPNRARGGVRRSVLVLVFESPRRRWWLSQDRSIPIYHAGSHLGFAIDVYEDLSSGHLLKALTVSGALPAAHLPRGSPGIFVGGVGVASPIIALNAVFVPLLALGCYRIGRLAFNPLAGLLAVVFALGSPFVIEEFHEFMLDVPEAAMVAVAVWAIPATERFSRPRVSALAGIAVGLGMLGARRPSCSSSREWHLRRRCEAGAGRCGGLRCSSRSRSL